MTKQNGPINTRCVLRLTIRSNVKPKCGNNSSESLHMFHAASYCEPANSTKSLEVDLDIYQDEANISYSQCDS